jgi:hypothetical protein
MSLRFGAKQRDDLFLLARGTLRYCKRLPEILNQSVGSLVLDMAAVPP